MDMPLIKRIVLTEVISVFLLLVISTALVITAHVPSATTLFQLFCLELLIIALPIRALLHSKLKPSKRAASMAHIYFEIGLFAVLTAGITYANYILFYARNVISPAYLDSANEIHLQAMSLTLVTFFVCQTLNILFFIQDDHPRLSLSSLMKQRDLIKKWAIAAVSLLFIIYFPLTQGIFRTQPLDIVDWSTILLLTSAYAGIRLIQRRSRHHTRHSVIHLHRQVHKS